MYVAINSPLLLSLPHSITVQHCCQSWMDIASRINSCIAAQKKRKQYAESPQNFSFSLHYLHLVNMRWVFQLPAEVSFKLAVILAIQLLGLKWEFKVNFMQI